MKSSKLLLLFVVLICGIGLSSCLKDDCDETRTFVEINPVWLPLEEIRVAPKSEDSRSLENPGKLYFYNDLILINERKAGVHVIDNSDPSNPKNVSFINIPGNVDMAVKDNYLYVDNYMDLLTLDFSDINNIKEVCRIEDVFINDFWQRDDRGVLVDYIETDNMIEVECDVNAGAFFNRGDQVFVDVAFDTGAAGPQGPQGAAPPAGAESSGAGGGVGTGGSLARFTIAKDHLYVIDNSSLFIHDVSRPEKPRAVNDVWIEWGIETLFPYQDLLFVGANNGMFIYDNKNPAAPQFLSKFEHARACDPVFVQGNLAYVTLRDGTRCEAFSNQLDVVDISDWRRPELLITHQMEHPHGLSVRGDHLYLCEGEHGFKVFDKTDPEKIPDNRTDHVKGVHAYDVISLSENHVLVIGDDGLYQYDTSDKDKLEEISVLNIQRDN